MKSNKLRIEKVVNGGYGLARQETGKTALIRGALPREQVTFRTKASTGTITFGEATEIADAHPDRIAPPCPLYPGCGGCSLQHCSYTGQLQLKQEIIAEIFGKTGISPEPIVPSPSPFGYRQRIRLQVQEGQIGFLRFRSNDIIPVQTCPLAVAEINTTLEQLQAIPDFTKLVKVCKEIELLYNPKDKKTVLRCNLLRRPRPADRRQAGEIWQQLPELATIFFTGDNFAQEPFHGRPAPPGEKELRDSFTIRPLIRPLPSYTLAWEVGGFCQVNRGQNSNLVQYVLQSLKEWKTKDILDLFCGMGNFSVPLAFMANSVTGIENQGAAVRMAAKNAEANGLADLTFLKKRAEAGCRELLERGNRFQITLLDPPRQGLTEAHRELCALTEEQIIYISCDPATLLRDIQHFAKEGFTLKNVRPFDMFPQTHHIETVAILEKE